MYCRWVATSDLHCRLHFFFLVTPSSVPVYMITGAPVDPWCRASPKRGEHLQSHDQYWKKYSLSTSPSATCATPTAIYIGNALHAAQHYTLTQHPTPNVQNMTQCLPDLQHLKELHLYRKRNALKQAMWLNSYEYNIRRRMECLLGPCHIKDGSLEVGQQEETRCGCSNGNQQPSEPLIW